MLFIHSIDCLLLYYIFDHLIEVYSDCGKILICNFDFQILQKIDYYSE